MIAHELAAVDLQADPIESVDRDVTYRVGLAHIPDLDDRPVMRDAGSGAGAR